MNVKAIIYKLCPGFLRGYLKRIEDSPIGYRLAKGSFWSIVGAVISRGLMLIASIVVARILGKEGFGEFGMIRSTVAMFTVFAGFSLGLTATKHVAQYRESDPARAGRIISLSWLVAAVTGGLMALALLLFAPWLAEHTINAPHLADVLRIGALILFINAINGAQTGALSGFEAFKAIAYVNLFVGLFSFPILVIGTYTAGLTGAVWALAINLGVNWLLNHIALRREAARYKVPISFKGCREEMPVLWKFSFPAVLSGAMVSPVMWGCKSMLANQPEGYGGLGAFTVAENWRAILLFPLGIISNAFFPVLSQIYAQGNRRIFKKTLFIQFVFNSSIVVFCGLLISLFSKIIMSAYGSDFTENYLVLVIVILSTIPMQLAAVAGMVNKCVGNIWWGFFLNSIWAVVYLLLTYLLVGYGAVGLSLATLISYCSHLVLTMIYVIWVFKTSPKLKGFD